jgi:predicted metalloprotease with PDZ domain
VAVIGAPALSKFLMSLDVSGSRMWLKPNSKYRTGYVEPAVGVGTKAEGGRLRVIHVAANSPAEAAEMKTGDEIVSINGARPQRSAIGDARPGDVIIFKLGSGETRRVTAALYY